MARTKVGQVSMARLVGSVSKGDASTNSLTVSHTSGAGSDLVLVVCISSQDSNDANLPISSVTFGGAALTLAKATPGNPNDTNSEIWYRLNPTPSTADVVVTSGTTVYKAAVIATFSGVLQQAPEAVAGSIGTSSGVSGAITALTDYALLIESASHKGAYSSVSTGQTLLGSEAGQSFEHCTASYKEVQAGAQTMGESWGSSNAFSHSIVSFACAVNVISRGVASRTTAGTRTVATI